MLTRPHRKGNAMSTTSQGRLRAADADREHAADQLRRHCADGRLSAEELEERLEAVYAAHTLADLEPPLADLPAEPPPRRPHARRATPAAPRHALTGLLVVLAVAGAIALLTGGPSWLLWAAGGWLVLGRPWAKGRPGGCHRRPPRRPAST